MEEQKTMKVTDALRMVANQLNAIQVPVGLADQIARPIATAAHTILACAEAQEKAEKKEVTENEG